MWQNPQFPADFVTITEEILNGKLHFLCSGCLDTEPSVRTSSSTFDSCIKLTEAYPEPCQTSKKKRFAKVVNGKKPLTIFTKPSILNVWHVSEYTRDQF